MRCIMRAKRYAHAWTFADKAASTDKSTRYDKILKISSNQRARKPAGLLGFLKISSISSKSSRILGFRGWLFSCAQMCDRKAHLVTICHRLREWPFFRVLEGERRIDGFPFGWRRNAPNRAVFGPYRMAHRDACEARTRTGILRVESQVPT